VNALLASLEALEPEISVVSGNIPPPHQVLERGLGSFLHPPLKHGPNPLWEPSLNVG